MVYQDKIRLIYLTVLLLMMDLILNLISNYMYTPLFNSDHTNRLLPTIIEPKQQTTIET